MIFLVLLFNSLLISNDGILNKILDSNKTYLNSSACPYAFKKQSAARIISVLEETREMALKEIIRADRSFDLAKRDKFKMLERIDFPYNNISGVIWGKDFGYSYKRMLGTSKIEIRKIKKAKLSESGMSLHIIAEVEHWNSNLLKKMISKPVNEWDKSYVSFLDSLKTHTSYNLSQTEDSFYVATRIENASEKLPTISTVAFDDF